MERPGERAIIVAASRSSDGPRWRSLQFAVKTSRPDTTPSAPRPQLGLRGPPVRHTWTSRISGPLARVRGRLDCPYTGRPESPGLSDHEAHLPAEEAQAGEAAWLPCPQPHPLGSRNPQAPAVQG